MENVSQPARVLIYRLFLSWNSAIKPVQHAASMGVLIVALEQRGYGSRYAGAHSDDVAQAFRTDVAHRSDFLSHPVFLALADMACDAKEFRAELRAWDPSLLSRRDAAPRNHSRAQPTSTDTQTLSSTFGRGSRSAGPWLHATIKLPHPMPPALPSLRHSTGSNP